ncbi:uncharacterized protein N7477_009564 [Penicillium maclennaniae]|uniref:uncharacterized protein n=1 Tax=Penicillium maclennaniae TaxID=1343394 RepID=UPI002541D24F|nr:uncharacterized protein N7477_009564 [Penicillium maclennaniae]KAJ5661948.1 hypothetical protein N7477_009564 [Penicillium maclennaniae]
MAPSSAKTRRNVRIDSLSPNRQIAAKDCRQCVTRRIKCDRSVPHCQKCSVRGLLCPGFPLVHLRWVQGVASRGRSASLRLSILGLAAAHLSATSAEFERSSIHLRVNQRLRNDILGTLSNKMHIERSANFISVGGGFLDFSLVEMLASMLVLCYGELHIPGSTDWKLHLRACHAIIERHHLRSMQELSGDVIAKWLINEVIDLEIFGNLSAFTMELDPSNMMAWPEVFDGDFWDFTLLINEITVAERSHYTFSHSSDGLVQTDMRYWHAKLDTACIRATMLISSFSEDEPLERNRFRAIIEAHYHACLIYNYQALASQAEAAVAIQSSSNDLWNIIVAVTMEPGPTFAHDIFFPSFHRWH